MKLVKLIFKKIEFLDGEIFILNNQKINKKKIVLHKKC